MGTSLRAAALLAFVVLSILMSLLISSVQQFAARVSNVTQGEEFLPEALLSQLAERRKEIVPLLFLSEDEKKFSDQPLDSTWDVGVWDKIARGSSGASVGGLGCESLVDMQALEVLGSGYTKLVLKASLAGGAAVALKLVNEQGIDMGKCVEEFHQPAACRQLVAYKLKKEMVLLKRLQHPNVIGLRGHCESHRAKESEEEGRLAVILEQGSPLQMIQLLQSPWEDRFKVCLDLVQLLHFLSRSPLGSVALLDFQPRQFVLVSGTLKLTDLDDISVEPTPCQTSADCTLLFPQRNFTVPCVRGVCEGLSQKRNMYNAYRYFFTYLLPHQAPPPLTHLVDHIMNSTGELKSDINETMQAFEDLLAQYQSGAHLHNLPPAELTDYLFLRRVGGVGGEYRCWLSHSAQGCVLSVHSPREAAHICNSHSQCSSFSLTGQRTWSGRLLASFRSSSAQLAPDSAADVYVKKTVSAAPSL